MTAYDFDQWIERRGTGCIKYDGAAARGRRSDVLSFWVADMDFETVPEVKEALRKRTEHGIYGYTMPDESYYTAVLNWMEKHHGWHPKREWCVYTPGVVFAFSMAIRAFTEPGESVIIQRPVYYPFTDMILANGRKLVNSPLKCCQEKSGVSYQMDFADFEAKLTACEQEGNPVRLFILCNPHNPVGRVWTEEELRQIGDLCRKHQVLVVSDEIHMDFIRKGKKHTVFSTLGDEYGDNAVICTSPSKTFNLAGLQISNIFISNPILREKFQAEIAATGYDEPNIFAQTACRAAYQYGEEWLTQLKEYLQGNIELVREYIKKELPKLHFIEPEGTYLVWIDFSGYGFTEQELEKRLLELNLWFDAGTMFGPEGAGFQRMNIATTRDMILQALKALKSLQGV